MKKTNFLLNLLFVCAFALSACTISAQTAITPAQSVKETLVPTAGPMTFTDGLGRMVTLKAPAQRIVSMAPSATETLFAIGAGAQVVGRDSFSNYPDSVKTLADVGGSSGNYSYEAITALHPDLVIAAEINTADQVKALENLGLTVYYVANPANFSDLFTEMVTLGKLTGHEAEAQSAADALSKRVEAVKSTIAKATTHPVVFYELDGTDPSNPWTSGPGSFMDQLITLAGGKNVAADLSSQWAQISIEDLLVKNPDLIILGDGSYGTTISQVAGRTGWDKLSAVQQKHIYLFNDDLVSRPGPRMVDGLEALAKLIHPELYQ